MKIITIAALILLMATSALAELDTEPNTIGIYLDTEANEVCVGGLVDGNTEFTFYMIITNPTFENMSGFLVGYHFEGIAGLTAAELSHPNAMDSGALGDHLVNYDSPVPTSAVTQLMTISAIYSDFEYGSAILKLHGISLAVKSGIEPSVILPSGECLNLNLSYDDNSTIRINSNCGPVANETMSFEGIKSLYR